MQKTKKLNKGSLAFRIVPKTKELNKYLSNFGMTNIYTIHKDHIEN